MYTVSASGGQAHLGDQAPPSKFFGSKVVCKFFLFKNAKFCQHSDVAEHGPEDAPHPHGSEDAPHPHTQHDA